MEKVETNPKVFELEIEAEPYQIRDVTKALLHTIMFHRSLILTKPIDANLNFVGITYVQISANYMPSYSIVCCKPKCDQAIIEKDVDHAATTLSGLAENQPGAVQTVDVFFFERKEKKGWLFKSPNDNVWERWRLKVKPHQPKSTEEKESFSGYLEKQLRACLLYIATVSLEESDHVPNISNLGKIFPYKIIVANGNPETLVGILRRMITDTSVPPLLG